MQENKTDITVIHLVWLPFGIRQFSHFLDSYCSCDAGCDHNLFFMFNGVQHQQDTEPYLQLARSKGLHFSYGMMEKGQDIDAYREAAKQISTEYILLLNSYATFKTKGWLSKYAALKSLQTVVSATASFQSHYSNVFQQYPLAIERGKGWWYHIRKYRLFLKAFFYWRWLFPAYPNPHLRTNALLIPRTTFLEIVPDQVQTKFRAYLFESGRKGLTCSLLKKHFRVLVIDREGQAIPMEQWPQSRTFWSSQQEQLIIADNQTDLYDQADAATKNKLTYLAWKQHGSIQHHTASKERGTLSEGMHPQSGGTDLP